MATSPCPICAAEIPHAVERVHIDSKLHDVTYRVPHIFALTAGLAQCPGSAEVIGTPVPVPADP